MLGRVDVFTGRMGDYLGILLGKQPAPGHKLQAMPGTLRGVGTSDTFTSGEPGLVATVTMREAGSVWLLFWILVWVECDTVMGLMKRVTRHVMSVIVMSSVIVTNDGCDTPPYTNRNHSHHKPSPGRLLRLEDSLLKSGCRMLAIFLPLFGWNVQVRGNEQARGCVARIMFSDCNNQKTASDTIASDWGDNEWEHLWVWQHYFSVTTWSLAVTQLQIWLEEANLLSKWVTNMVFVILFGIRAEGSSVKRQNEPIKSLDSWLWLNHCIWPNHSINFLNN